MTSSAWSRSLPQPPHSVSLPVPPTSQSFSRSPKITSLPSVARRPNSRQVAPWVESRTQPLTGGPAVLLALRNQSQPEPKLSLFAVPSSFSRIARRGSNSSYRPNSPPRLGLAGCHESVSPPNASASPGFHGVTQSLRSTPTRAPVEL